MFEFLFKYPPDLYARGEFVVAGSWWLYLCTVLIVAPAIFTVLRYIRVRGESRTSDRLLLGVTRTAILAILILALFQPMLRVTTQEARGNVVGVLLDDSLSMNITDQGGQPRAQFVQRAFDPQTGEITRELAKHFAPRFFRFAAGAQPLQAADTMSYSGRTTNLARALEQVRRELGDATTAALVVVSDGAVTEPVSLDKTLAFFRAAGIPIHVVGVGQDKFIRDIEITNVAMPRQALKGASIAADVLIKHRGFDNERARLLIEDDGRLLAMEDVTLLARQPAQTVRVQFLLKEAGPRHVKFHIVPATDEVVSENNTREAELTVQDRRQRILYFEGEPRFEVKFIRRALAKDDNIRIVSLIRTAESKFYRLGIDTPQELATGFPQRPEELFSYDGLILGSVEAGFFSTDQLQMIADFVSRRGGGLLVLGGKRTFANGGYFATPVAEVLPLVLEAKQGQPFRVEARVQPTARTETHPLTEFMRTEKNISSWKTLPPLTVLHPLYAVKPGATVLLEGRTPGLSSALALLTQQRFGRGQALVFNVQNSWRWRMHQDIPLDDQTHQTLWRQLLRWLVQSVPDRITFQTSASEAVPQESVEVRAQVLDAGYLPRNNAEVRLIVTTPIGDQLRLPMHWVAAQDGIYQAHFMPKHAGMYDVRVETPSENGFDTAETHIQVGAATREYFQAEMNEILLRRIATATGGQFYTAADVSKLVEEVKPVQAGATVLKRLPLWNMPAAFLLLLVLIAFEWVYRRWRGLV